MEFARRPGVLPVYHGTSRRSNIMQKAAKDESGTAAGQWAEVFAGDSALMIGTNKILTDKKVGTVFLADARDLYAKALEIATIPEARQQAMFGKARAMESLIQNKDDLEKTVATYKELNEAYPHGMFKPIADQRIESLQKKSALTFYEALAQYTPKAKVESPQSQLGKLGALPENPPEAPPTPTPPVRSEAPSRGKVPEPPLMPAEPVKSKAPKTEGEKPQAAKPETPKTEPAKKDASKPEAAKPEASKPDAKGEAPKADAAKKDK